MVELADDHDMLQHCEQNKAEVLDNAAVEGYLDWLSQEFESKAQAELAATDGILSCRTASRSVRLSPKWWRAGIPPPWSKKLALQVGKDLQYIRINGTLVGGMVVTCPSRRGRDAGLIFEAACVLAKSRSGAKSRRILIRGKCNGIEEIPYPPG